ncbi:TonB-dependent siderophore receptor [Campylobacter sp. 19-13652]|uniref:TonB-dependent receptor n=1 Tax=Campylobacter sp. 19-13652 TaxID=2840180 RepID=UPI001C76824A|nr:TonB-dependent receptor [Campylobacter sp. 19-13652]BCX78612.1 TonB-dependent receptor [Campylobacter sp. 19-13652]
MKAGLSLVACVLVAGGLGAAQDYSVVLPTVDVEGISEQDFTKGYVAPSNVEVNKNGLSIKETPQSIEAVDVQKNRNYGTNDLSSILEGNSGVDASYDTRGDGIKIRGFSVDGGDIYRDGVRDSGQIRRSTANIERVEILKGPASILYGRSQGGGVINLVSKKANFSPLYKLSARAGSWDRYGGMVDVNHVISDTFAVRLTGDYEQGKSWRDGVKYRNKMISPSFVVTNQDGTVSFEAQYTYDDAWRVPDRNPEKSVYDAMGISYNKGFAHNGDFVKDTLHFLRTELNAELVHDINLKWIAGYRKASQDFDNFFAGTYDVNTRMLTQNYAAQQTDNTTLSSTVLLNREFEGERVGHKVSFGYDYSIEKREPRLKYQRGFTASIDPFASSSSWNSARYDRVSTHNKHKAITHGVFIDDLITFDERYHLLIGGRYDWYEFKSTDINQNSRSYKDGAFSPRIGVLYDITPEHTLYASYSKSFAPYGGNGWVGVSTTTNDIQNLAKKQTNEQYEVGLKSEWANKRFMSTVAVYEIRHKNNRYNPDSNDPYLWAQRDEKSRGIELNLLGELAKGVYMRSSVGYMSAKTSGDEVYGYRNGLELENTTHWQGNVFLRYAYNDLWYLEGGVTAYSKRYHYVYNDAAKSAKGAHLPGFVRVDMSAGYKFSKHASMTLAVNNLFDKEYWRSSSRPGDRRSFMSTFVYEF